MKRFMGQMEYYKQQVLSCEFVFIPREGNDVADALAKSGVSRQHDLVILYEQWPQSSRVFVLCFDLGFYV